MDCSFSDADACAGFCCGCGNETSFGIVQVNPYPLAIHTVPPTLYNCIFLIGAVTGENGAAADSNCTLTVAVTGVQ